VPAGQVLIREGEPGDLFFIVVEGSAEVRKGNRRIATLRAGDFAGEIALVTDEPRTATVRTTALLDTSPTIQRKVLRTLADRLAPTAL